ncbi:MAG: SHOCT domain-containing protein [Betaproteobacteria bacterium]|nr:SHOCT domain-containing protein [Betaproteobacteria bacterium]
MMWEYGMGWGWGWFGMMLFWLVPILLVALALKYFFDGGIRPSPGAREEKQKALVVLEERYARGEIDREEFLEKRDDLKRG